MQRLAARVDDLGAGRDGDGAVGADGGDALADDEERHPRPHHARLGVEEPGAGEGDAGRGALGE